MSLIVTDGYGVFDLDKNVVKTVLVHRFKARLIPKVVIKARVILKERKTYGP